MIISDTATTGPILKRHLGKRYTGNIIHTQDNIQEVECSVECTLKRPNCKSINYNKKTKECHLFDNTAKYLSDLEDDEDMIYLSRTRLRMIDMDFIAYPRRNFAKGTFLTIENISFRDCVMKCKTLTKCKSFTYYPTIKKCQLKNDWAGLLHNLNLDENTHYFTKKEYPISNYMVYMKKDLPGYKICRLDDVNLKQCASECDKRKMCVSFTYSSTERYCVLKSKGVRMMKRLKNDLTKNYYLRPNYYKIYKNTQLPLSTFQTINDISIQECKHTCELNEQCKGFTYKYDFSCQLKNAQPQKFTNLQPNNEYHYYQKIAVINYEVYPSYEYEGADIESVETINPILCAKTCDLNDLCKGYVIKKNVCILKKEVGTKKEDRKMSPDSYLYVKVTKKTMKMMGYAEYEDKTYMGSDLFWMEYNDKMDCMAICRNLTNCKGFVVYNNICWFKEKAKNYGDRYVDKMNAVLYVKTTKPKMVEGYEMHVDKFYMGHDHSEYPLVDVHDCSRKCTMRKECKAFAIRHGKCLLKTEGESSGPSYTDQKLSTLYLKKWRKCEY